MTTLRLVAREEWTYWLRSRLALSTAALFFILLVTTALVTFQRIEAERHERQHHQQEAESIFLEQPDRHPHRMVHYGHYVFRTPAPLAVFDPGLDPVTGHAMFLEGHRQNSAAFADSGSGAWLGRLATLTPAVVYQYFAPLLLILLGHGAIARERESATLVSMLAQGVSARAIVAGKALALLSAAGLMLVPLLFSGAAAVVVGESLGAVLAMLAVYGLYLVVWSLLSLLFSALLRKRSLVLASLTALWLALTLLLPSLAVSNTARALPIPGRIETDLTMLADLRELGDGHNAADPAFQQLRAELLARYDVEAVEDLPVNFRGVVAQYSEAQQTETLNEYAERRMRREAAQTALLARHGWASPMLAAADASRALAATDLQNHHRFVREAEALRIEFVQGLNRVHAEELDYSLDVNRNQDADASQRARVSSANWSVLREFRFEPASFTQRLGQAGPSILALLSWCLALLAGTAWTAARIRP